MHATKADLLLVVCPTIHIVEPVARTMCDAMLVKATMRHCSNDRHHINPSRIGLEYSTKQRTSSDNTT
eukprot:2495185-Amphidinium_carterae.1